MLVEYTHAGDVVALIILRGWRGCQEGREMDKCRDDIADVVPLVYARAGINVRVEMGRLESVSYNGNGVTEIGKEWQRSR